MFVLHFSRLIFSNSRNNNDVVKCGLKQLIRDDPDEINAITIAVKDITTVERLASLYAHWHVTTTVLENEYKINDMFKVKFDAIKYYQLMQISNKQSKHELEPAFLALLDKHNVNKPNVAGIGQIMKYSSDAYAKVFKTNVNTHTYSRIRQYMKTLVDYKKKDNKRIVYSTLDFLKVENSKKNTIEWFIKILHSGCETINVTFQKTVGQQSICFAWLLRR